jgi:hypothetical protein
MALLLGAGLAFMRTFVLPLFPWAGAGWGEHIYHPVESPGALGVFAYWYMAIGASSLVASLVTFGRAGDVWQAIPAGAGIPAGAKVHRWLYRHVLRRRPHPVA